MSGLVRSGRQLTHMQPSPHGQGTEAHGGPRMAQLTGVPTLGPMSTSRRKSQHGDPLRLRCHQDHKEPTAPMSPTLAGEREE